EAVCGSLAAGLVTGSERRYSAPGNYTDTLEQAAEALRQAREFMSRMNGPPMSEEKKARLTRTFHALGPASRLVETAREVPDFGGLTSDPEDVRASELCADAMRYTVAALRGLSETHHTGQSPAEPAVAADDLLIQLERCAKSLAEFRASHRN